MLVDDLIRTTDSGRWRFDLAVLMDMPAKMMGRMTLSYSVALIIGPAITGMIGTTTQTREDGSG